MTAEQVQELKRAIEDYWQAGYNMGFPKEWLDLPNKPVPPIGEWPK